MNQTETTHAVVELPLIDNVDARSPTDEECLQEIREVLQRHGKASRFGVILLYRHFDVEEDEILVETSDPESRTLIIQPVKKDDIKDVSLIETNWRLDIRSPVLRCHQYCLQGPGGIHVHQHQHIRV